MALKLPVEAEQPLKRRLLDQVRDRCRVRHLALSRMTWCGRTGPSWAGENSGRGPGGFSRQKRSHAV
jgi:hypothetical protein